MNRRAFLKKLAGLGLAASVAPAVARARNRGRQRKVVVLGFDGMDPEITRSMMLNGGLPNFSQITETGCFHRLGTVLPPHSPVVWASFITGTNPGGHGIYDFVHRDPDTYMPYLSTSQSAPGRIRVKLGDLTLPLSEGKLELLRRGKPFWEFLDRAEIRATLYRLPTNFPPSPTRSRTFSGLGTPDIRGTPGMFSYFTTAPPANSSEITGGEVFPVRLVQGRIRTSLAGPPNAFRKGEPDCRVEFDVWVDRENSVAKVAIQGHEFMLNEREWSDWVRVRFDMLRPVASVTGICRFYLQEVHPEFRLYVTAINIDPARPAMPISTPPAYSRGLHKKLGDFYTKGMAEDTKALSYGIFSDEEYLTQSDQVLQDHILGAEYEIERFKDGFLFLYFSNTDLDSHMFWRAWDPHHHLHDSCKQFKEVIRERYRAMDEMVGKVLRRVDSDTTIIIVSDHGFAPFYRGFSLNRWLKDNGYVSFHSGATGAGSGFSDVSWSRTRAYGLGLNGLYLNLHGRESNGIVRPAEKESLMDELASRLEQVRDPATGVNVVAKVYRAERAFSGAHTGIAPDLVLGYARGYQASWETGLGGFSEEIISDNQDKWSGTHLIEPSHIHGIFLSNKRSKFENPSMVDIAPTILAEFGLRAPPAMEGRALF